jgi:WD40 repeat protein
MESPTYGPRRAIFATGAVAALLAGAWFTYDAMQEAPVDHKVSSVALSQSGRWMAAGTSQGRVVVWDQKGKSAPRRIRFTGGPLNDLQVSPDDSQLALAGRDLATCELATSAAPRFLKQDQRNYGTVRYSQDGGSMLVITGGSAIELLDAQSGAPRFSVCCSTIAGEVAFTPDGAVVVNAGHWPRLWDAHSGQMVGQLLPARRTYTFRSIAFDRTRATVAMGSQDGRVYVWDLPGRRLAAVSEPQQEYVDALATTSTGWLAYCASGRVLRLWNPASGQYRSVAGANPTSNLILSPDGTSILFGTAAGTVESWNLTTGQRLSSRQLPEFP